VYLNLSEKHVENKTFPSAITQGAKVFTIWIPGTKPTAIFSIPYRLRCCYSIPTCFPPSWHSVICRRTNDPITRIIYFWAAFRWKGTGKLCSEFQHLGHPRVTVARQSDRDIFTFGLHSSQFCSRSLFPLLSIVPLCRSSQILYYLKNRDFFAINSLISWTLKY
jgi:hypothetical protein